MKDSEKKLAKQKEWQAGMEKKIEQLQHDLKKNKRQQVSKQASY